MSTPQSAINPDDDVRRQRLLAAMQQAMQPKRPQRQAWDERLPSGMSVPELLSRTQQQADVNSGQRGGAALGSPTVNIPPNAGLQPPTLPAPNVNLGTPPAMPPAPGEGGYTPDPVRIGYGNKGLTGLDALQARRHALEEADPESKVTATGEILPPTPMSRWRGAATLGGLGMNAGDANHPLRELGGLLGGGIRGAISPRTAAKAQRQTDIARTDQQIEGAQDRVLNQAKIDQVLHPKAENSTRVVGEGEYPDIPAGTEIRTRIDPRTGSVTDEVFRNKPVVSKLPRAAAAGAPHYDKDTDGYLITVQGGKSNRVIDEKTGQPVKVKSDDEKVEVTQNGRTFKVSPGQALSHEDAVAGREGKAQEEDVKNSTAREGALKEVGRQTDIAKIYENNANTAEETLNRERGEWAQKRAAAQAQADANGETLPKDAYIMPSARERQLLAEISRNKTGAKDAHTAAEKAQNEANKIPGGGRGTSQAAPSGDGKHHYTMAQIQATIDPKTGKTKTGLRLEEVLNKLRNDSRAVIDDDQR